MYTTAWDLKKNKNLLRQTTMEKYVQHKLQYVHQVNMIV